MDTTGIFSVWNDRGQDIPEPYRFGDIRSSPPPFQPIWHGCVVRKRCVLTLHEAEHTKPINMAPVASQEIFGGADLNRILTLPTGFGIFGEKQTSPSTRSDHRRAGHALLQWQGCCGWLQGGWRFRHQRWQSLSCVCNLAWLGWAWLGLLRRVRRPAGGMTDPSVFVYTECGRPECVGTA